MKSIISFMCMALFAVGISAQTKILVIGAKHNVSSNYYPNVMISEETGIPVDSIDFAYNNVIISNIIHNSGNGQYEFVMPGNGSMEARLVNSIKIGGDKENMFADFSSVDSESYRSLLSESGADYMLFISQHYLRWQETPMRTLFHFVSYTIVDKDGNKICDGSKNFSSMNLLNSAQLGKKSRKSSVRIAMATIDKIRDISLNY